MKLMNLDGNCCLRAAIEDENSLWFGRTTSGNEHWWLACETCRNQAIRIEWKSVKDIADSGPDLAQRVLIQVAILRAKQTADLTPRRDDPGIIQINHRIGPPGSKTRKRYDEIRLA